MRQGCAAAGRESRTAAGRESSPSDVVGDQVDDLIPCPDRQIMAEADELITQRLAGFLNRTPAAVAAG